MGGQGVRVENFGYKNAIKHEKGDPLYFLTTPRTPLNEFGQSPKDPPNFQLLCIYVLLDVLQQKVRKTLKRGNVKRENKRPHLGDSKNKDRS
jgi:hypothetical protein